MEARLDHIVLNVHDTERALAFYTEVIGLAAERVEGWRKGELPFPSVRLNADTIIDLLPPELWGRGADAQARPNMDHFCMAVAANQWPALEKRLAAAGVAIELGPMTLSGAHGDGTAVYIRDSEGNRVELRYY